MQNMNTTTGQPVKIVAEAAPLSDGQLIQLACHDVPDAHLERWTILHIRKAVLMAAAPLTKYAQRRKSAAVGALARALEAAGRAIVEA